jgi:transcriptional regulator of acetoin/glycerol metabolism/DNA-binding CsgD family transcriptional regulator
MRGVLVADDTLTVIVPGTGHQLAPESQQTGRNIRDEIAVSWHRSLLYGLRPDHVEAPYDADLDTGGRLAQAAAPVADQLSEDLAGSGVALLLADERARLIDRRVSDSALRVRLDQFMVAPGFIHGEEHIGTNAIGTALRQAGPVAISGHEHFADVLSFLVCSAAPITDPWTGNTVGAVGLTCAAETANPLMLPLVKRARREIEQRLLEDPSATDAALQARFQQARRRARGPLLSINERTMHTTASAARLLQPADHAVLWTWASLALASGAAAELRLTSGLPVTARVRAVHDGRVLIGALIRFEPPAPGAQPARDQPTSGWNSLTDTECGVAGIIAEGATNREAAARLYLSRHTIDFHLRQIFRKLGITSRVELARIFAEQNQASRGPAA